MYTPELLLHVQPELQGEDDPEAQAELPAQHAPHVPAPAQQQVQVTTDKLSPRVLLYPRKHIYEITHLIIYGSLRSSTSVNLHPSVLPVFIFLAQVVHRSFLCLA